MNDVATIEPRKGKLLSRFSDRFGVDQDKMLSTLKQTAFKVSNGEATNEQMMALLVVADQHGLNPFTREIYAFPDQKGIVPVVGVDGWARIINEHPQFDGMDFEQDTESCTCIIYRKDRNHPIRITEYMTECSRNTGPWKTHPRRMLRHKTMIQASRIAFGFAGIYDQDEAERIQEAQAVEPVHVEPSRPERQTYSDVEFENKLPAWEDLIRSGTKTAEDIINVVGSRVDLSSDQQKTIRNLGVDDAEVEEKA